MPRLIARWNRARDVWETETGSLFCAHWDVFSETWPTSGTTRAGRAYLLPPWEPHTSAGGSSSPPSTLVPTPRSRDVHGAGVHGDGGLNLRTVAHQLGGGTLLPTPRASDGDKGGPNMRGSSGDVMLPNVAVALLPTPVAVDYGRNRSLSDGAAERLSLPSMARTAFEWGDYQAAIWRHQAILGREAPPPTIEGRGGRPKLSPYFVEWLMMLEEGHVTSVPGISVNAKLRLLGNGVVPAQALAAFRHLFALHNSSSSAREVQR